MQIEKSIFLFLVMSVGAWFVIKPAMQERSYNNEKNVMIGVDRRFGPNTYVSTMPEQDKWLYGMGDVRMPNSALPEEPCFAAITFFFQRKDYVSRFEVSGPTTIIHYDGLPSYKCVIDNENIVIKELGTNTSLNGTIEDTDRFTTTILTEGKKHRIAQSWPRFSPQGRTYRGVLSETPEGMQRMATLFEQ